MMRWNIRKEQDYLEWHQWFAWHPVRINGQWVWLETVERKFDCGWASDWWDYR